MTRMIYSFLKIKYENSNRNGLFCNRKILHPYLNKSFFSCEQILQSMNVCETERRQLRVMPSIKNILIGGYLLKVIRWYWPIMKKYLIFTNLQNVVALSYAGYKIATCKCSGFVFRKFNNVSNLSFFEVSTSLWSPEFFSPGRCPAPAGPSSSTGTARCW